MRTAAILILLLSNLSYSQTDTTRFKSIEYHFNQINQLETNELIKVNMLDDSLHFKQEYKDENGSLNDRGIDKYSEIKIKVYHEFFSSYLYLQDVTYKDRTYGLYFTMAGFDDIEFHILSFSNKKWRGPINVTRNDVDSENGLKFILFNYDEGPKNIDNVRLFHKGKYLVMERSGLYHSLYDMELQEVLYNDESPLFSSDDASHEGMNRWIKNNLHNPISRIID